MTLYDEICAYDNLLLAFKKARRKKTGKWYVLEFEKNLKNNLLTLQKELLSQSYKPSPTKVFVIHEPRTRIISASHFRDRVIHHALCNVIELIFEKSFIYDSYASIKEKGTHAAIRRFDAFKYKVTKNGKTVRRAKHKNMPIGYILKADIKHYFDTVDRSILLSILKGKIYDEKTIRLIEKIIMNHSSGKGMPIGNLTSQLFANIYLNELDYFVKHKLKARYYIRYLDDFVILHNDKNLLETWKVKINEFLKYNLSIELHPEKSQVYPLCKGVNFLGFRIFYYHKLLKKRNMRAIRHRLNELIENYKCGESSKEEIYSKLEGWIAYAMHGNTYKFCNNLKKEAHRWL